MAVTLAQSAVLSQDKLTRGIIEELIRESPILAKLPFVTLVGNALAVNREDPDHMGNVGFYGAGDVWTESAARFLQSTFALTTLGGDADVPNLIQRTRSNINDQMAAQVKIKTKLMGHAFEESFVYGNETVANQFAGLHRFMEGIPDARHLHAGGAPLTMALLDELVDSLLGGKPDMILVNKAIRRRISQALRAVGSYQTERDDYGNYWVMWNEVPIGATDFINQTEALNPAGEYDAAVGGVTSSIFAFRFGEGDGLAGIQNGGIETEVWPRLEQRDAMRTRIKWYCGTALYSTTALARVDGITDAVMVI